MFAQLRTTITIDREKLNLIPFVICFSTWPIFFIFVLKVINNDKWRKTVRTHQQSISDLKIGFPGTAILFGIEYAATVMSYWYLDIAFNVFAISRFLLVIVFSLFVLEEAEGSSIPKNEGWAGGTLLFIALIVGCWRMYAGWEMMEIAHFMYIYLIGTLVIYAYIVYNCPIEVEFRKKIDGKYYTITHKGIKVNGDPFKNLKKIEEKPSCKHGSQCVHTVGLYQRNLHKFQEDQKNLVPKLYEGYHLPYHRSRAYNDKEQEDLEKISDDKEKSIPSYYNSHNLAYHV